MRLSRTRRRPPDPPASPPGNPEVESLRRQLEDLIGVLRTRPLDFERILHSANIIAASAASPALKRLATALQAAALDPSDGDYEHCVRTATHVLLLTVEELQQQASRQ